jgi:hypothetical protein
MSLIHQQNVHIKYNTRHVLLSTLLHVSALTVPYSGRTILYAQHYLYNSISLYGENDGYTEVILEDGAISAETCSRVLIIIHVMYCIVLYMCTFFSVLKP